MCHPDALSHGFPCRNPSLACRSRHQASTWQLHMWIAWESTSGPTVHFMRRYLCSRSRLMSNCRRLPSCPKRAAGFKLMSLRTISGMALVWQANVHASASGCSCAGRMCARARYTLCGTYPMVPYNFYSLPEQMLLRDSSARYRQTLWCRPRSRKQTTSTPNSSLCSTMCARMGVRVCTCVCMCACVCLCSCVWACGRVEVHGRAS